ncbi:ABC transporter permease [Mucilaginibacter jinjuensis]|uniref:ABC transporter permease n=1 Tax=Mucilaginibacter jinjuensis TaxID=1176721 RepID=A0ABY7T2J1_9SPHI|nr:ABC transporter permease [Mucilaginibacter jinjuensis]WCT10541.1 ABC transporter permease [Mucilaginibacter jinjuensis]
MFKNYLKVALRSLLKRKAFSVINILGLATGMAVCLLIVLFIQDELSYDKFQEKGDRIYRIALDRIYPGRSTSYAIIPASIGDAARHDFPEIEQCTRMFDPIGNGTFPLKYGDKVFEERKVLIADSNFFNVFSYKALAGNPLTALTKVNNVVISESTAKRIFGSADQAIGKQFLVDQNNANPNFVISAVVQDWPANSHFKFSMLISASSFPFTSQPNYTGFSAYTYLLLKPGASPQAVDAKLPSIVKKYVAGEIGRSFGETYEQFTAAGNGYHYYLQPLTKIHLISDLESELSVNGSMTTIYLFSVIAIFILALACINFINLSTSLSVERAKEVGIRKTFGSDKQSIVYQFLTESVIISLMSLVIAFGLILLLLPLFNQIADKDLSVLYFITPLHLLLLVVFAIVLGGIAGIYPAFILSSFNPITVLKGRFKSNKYGLFLRNGLVIFQFSISIVLIIATIIVNQQINFMQGDKLGFKKDHIIVVNNAFLLNKQTKAFKNELLKIPGVESVSGTSTMPGDAGFFGVSYQPEGSKQSITGRGIVVDDDFSKLLGLEVKQGRFFSESYPTDSLGLVLNEKAVSEMGLKNPIGARLTSPGVTLKDGSNVIFTVIGVVKDFHYQSLHQKITPLIFNSGQRNNTVFGEIGVKVKSDHFQSTLNSIQHTWDSFVKDHPYHYNFLDQTVAEQYHAEQTAQKVFSVFTVLAIFIACIGLMGLAAYATQQRIREIGIRKVLGASISGIVSMLSVDFLKLILFASLVAFPIAWFAMHSWLQNFAYRVAINWLVFILAAGISVLIAMLTISFQAIKAALTNPIKSLRSE